MASYSSSTWKPVPTSGTRRHPEDERLGLDSFARAALDTFSTNGQVSLPTNNAPEIRAFFSRVNYEALSKIAQERTGFPIHGQMLWESMLFAFSQIKPRSENPTVNPRARDFSPSATASYVAEMNELVLSRVCSDTVRAQRHAEFARSSRRGSYMNIGESEDQPVDTRTRMSAGGVSFDSFYF